MSSLLALVSVLALVFPGTTGGTPAGTAPPIDGRLVDARGGAPVAGAEITIVGRSGSVRTDALGRFQWPAIPPLPIDVIAVWEGGLQFSGGFIAAILVGAPSFRRWPTTTRWRLLDGMALGLAVGMFFGRIGCYAVGEHLGGPTDFFLASRYDGGSRREDTLGDLPLQIRVGLREPRGSLPYPILQLVVSTLQILLGLLALGDVVLHPDKVDELPTLVVYGGEPELIPE